MGQGWWPTSDCTLLGALPTDWDWVMRSPPRIPRTGERLPLHDRGKVLVQIAL